jgi:hypothetical protein
VRKREADDEVPGYEESDEERRVGERGRRDDVLAGDVDGGEAGGRQEADEEQVGELPVS